MPIQPISVNPEFEMTRMCDNGWEWNSDGTVEPPDVSPATNERTPDTDDSPTEYE